MTTETYSVNTKSGTVGGLCLVLMIKTNWYDILHSILLAAVGAATSYIVSVCMAKFAKRWFRK